MLHLMYGNTLAHTRTRLERHCSAPLVTGKRSTVSMKVIKSPRQTGTKRDKENQRRGKGVRGES